MKKSGPSLTDLVMTVASLIKQRPMQMAFGIGTSSGKEKTRFGRKSRLPLKQEKRCRRTRNSGYIMNLS
jgi:hypothetical protein